MTTFSAASVDCRKFAPNIFNRAKCQNCFRTKDAHSAEALESNRATRKAAKCGYLFVAPDWDFSLSVNRTKRWQRRWFVLYDDGELTYSVDEHPDTVPQAVIDMNKVTEVNDAEHITGNPFSIAIVTPEKTHYIKGTSREESRWWYDVLSGFPKNTIRNKHKRNATYPGTKPSLMSEKCPHRGDGETADQRRVEVENANNKLHSILPTPTIITIKDRDGLNEEVPVKEKAAGEIFKSTSRRYLKKDNKVVKNQRSRSDGVSKMVPCLTMVENTPKNYHHNPVFFLLSDDKGGEATRRNSSYQDSGSNVDQNEIQMRGDPDGCGLDYTNHPCPKNEGEMGQIPDLLLKQGWLTRQSSSQEWHKHWFILQGLSLKYYRDPASQILDGVLDMGQVQRIREVDLDNRAAFCIEMADSKKHVLAAATTSLRTNWIMSILTASGLPTHISDEQNLDIVPKPYLQNSFDVIQRPNIGNKPQGKPPEKPKLIDTDHNPLEQSEVLSFKPCERDKNDLEELPLCDKVLEALTDGTCPSSPSNEERAECDSLKDGSYYTLPPSPLLNRTAISRVKEKARSRSSSRSRSSRKLQRTPDSSFFTADSDLLSDDDLSASFGHSFNLESPLLGEDTVDDIKASSGPYFEDLCSFRSNPKINSIGKEDKSFKTCEPAKDRYKDLEDQYLNLKRKYEIAEKKRIENSEYKALRCKYDSLKMKYKRDKSDIESKAIKDTDCEKGKRDSDRKSKKEIEISRLKGTIIELQERCAKLQENIAHQKLEIAFLSTNLNLKIRENDIIERELLIAQEALNKLFAEDNKNGDSKFENAYQSFIKKYRNTILNIQNELRVSYKNYDDLEIYTCKLKRQISEMEANHNYELRFLNARIDDLTEKLYLSEKNARQVKQKLTKLEAKQERRRSSLKSKESMSLSKEYEAKLSELEQKLASIEVVLNPTEEKGETRETPLPSPASEPDGLASKPSSVQCNQSKVVESKNMLMRLYDLDTKVKAASQRAYEEENPKTHFKISKDGKAQAHGEEKKDVPHFATLPVLEALKDREKVFSTISECCDFLERKVESVLEWLRSGFHSFPAKEAHREIKLMQKFIERCAKKQEGEKKNDLENLLYNILLIKEIVRALNHYSKVPPPNQVETMLGDTIKKLDSILTLISNDEFCIWTRPDVKEDLKRIFFEDFPALAQYLGTKMNKSYYNLYEKPISELKAKLKEINITWFPHNLKNSSMIDIEEILECIKSNMKNIFFKNIEQQVLAIHFSTVQILKAHFQQHYNEELSFLSGQSTKEPMEMVLKICTLAYLIASICFLQSLLEMYEKEPLEQEKDEETTLMTLAECQAPGIEQDFFALQKCPKASAILSMGTNNLDLSQVAYAYQVSFIASCSSCPILKEALEQAQQEHHQEVKTLQDRIDQLVTLLEKKEEDHKEEVRLLKEKLDESCKIQEQIREECSAHIESLQVMYSQKLNQSNELQIDESIRRRYKQEIDQLKNLCDKGLTALESSHRHVIQKMQKAHEKEVQELQAEKDKILAEETQATITALQALKRNHQLELEKLHEKLARQKSDAEPQPQLYMEELAEVRQGIVDLLDRCSAKCLEKVTLEERLEASLHQLQEANLQVLDLAAQNKQLRAYASTNFCQQLDTLSHTDSALKDMLALKHQEVVKQQDEISHLRQQLTLAQTHADTLKIHCQELEEALQSLREAELGNFAKRLEALIRAGSADVPDDGPAGRVPDDAPSKDPGPTIEGALLKTSSGPPIWVKSYSCSHEVQQRPSYPGAGTYTGSSAWRASSS